MRGKNFQQFLKYLLVGVITNSVGYLAYILLTSVGVSPKITITIIYCSAAAIGFFANKNFTFGYSGQFSGAASRYLVMQALGYFLNLMMIIFFFNELGFDHKLVQAVAIIVVALFLFFTSRFYVFPKTKNNIRENYNDTA